MMAQADLLGYTISESTAAAADQFNDRLGTLGATITGFKTNLAAAMLPTLNALAAEFLNTKTQAESMDKAVRIAAAGMKILLTGAELVRLVFEQVGEGFGALAAALVTAAQGNWRQAWEILKLSAEEGRDDLQQSITRILDIWETASQTAYSKAPEYGQNMAAPALVAVKITREAAEEMRRIQSQLEAANRSTMTNLEQQVARWNEFEDDLALLQKKGVIDSATAANRRNEFTSEMLTPITVTAQKISTEVQNTYGQLTVFAEEAARGMQSAFADFLFDPMKEGFKGMLAGFVDSIRRMVAEVAAAQILQAFFGWAANATGNAFLGAMANTAGTRAAGGPVSAGSAYLVGERGPELFMPRQSGTIIPNGMGGGVSVNYTINAQGADADRVLSVLPPLLKRTKDETIAQVRDLISRGRLT